MAASTSELTTQMTFVTDVLLDQGQHQTKLVEECHKQLKTAEENAQKSSATAEQKEKVEAIGKAANEAVNMLNAIRKGEKLKGVLSALSIISNLAALAGPAGAAISAVCTVLSTVLSITMAEQEESMLTQMRRAIKEELQRFRMELLQEEGDGLMGLGDVLIDELNFELKKGGTAYTGFSEAQRIRLDRMCEYMDKLKSVAGKKMSALVKERPDTTTDHTSLHGYFNAFKKLESYTNILKDDTKKARVTLAQDCLSCLVGYANVSTLYIIILTLHETLSRRVGLPEASINFLAHKIENAKKEGKELFGFFPDFDMLGPIGWWEGKLRVMEEYRKTPHTLDQIEQFQKLVNLPLAEYTTEEASYALKLCLVLRAHITYFPLEPTFSRPPAGAGDEYLEKNDNHYLCFVNNTRWPISIFSGLLGNQINKTKFEVVVDPHDVAVRPCVDVNDSFYFSSAGVIAVGERGLKLAEMRKVQYIEFALSNPWGIQTSYRKKIVTQPHPCYDKEHLEKVTYGNDLLTPYDHAKSFTYDKRFCLVRGELRKEGDMNDPGFTLYRIFIEEFDHKEFKKKTDESFTAFMSSYKSSFGTPPGRFASKFNKPCVIL